MPAETPPAAPAPKGTRKTPVAEPTYTTSGGEPEGPSDVMDVNPTSRADLEARGVTQKREYIPDPYGGKAGPAHLVGEDLARSGGGPEVRIDDRQAKMVDKWRNDPATKKLMAEESKKTIGGIPNAPEVTPEEARAAAAADPVVEEPKTAAERNADDVAEIAKLSREKRELKDKIKAADGARTEAKRLEMYKEIANDYPLAAVKALLGVDPEQLYADDVANKSKSVGDKFLNLDPAKAIETDDAVGAERTKREAAEARAAELEGQVSRDRAARAAISIAREDGKRFELCLRDPEIGGTVVAEVQKVYREADAKAGGQGKGWRPKDDAEAVEFTRSILDDLEKHYESLGKRFSRGTSEAVTPRKGPPKPPPGQRQPQSSRAPQELDRYARPPKRESVEDRQDALIKKYSGLTFTE
jgi:hypothetical protein